ncbi:MAG: arylsulfatase [Acidobacteria bacterium]|nr:arylsulfatase [Acidobacteriota bacterium]
MPLRDTGFHLSYYLADQDRFSSPTRHFLDDQPLPAVEPNARFYATNAITDRALEFLEEHRKNHIAAPFFLYLAYTSPHFPLHALDADIRRYKERYLAGWDAVRQQRWERVHSLGLVKTGLAPLEPDVFTPWNTPDAELKSKIGPGEVTRAVPWKSLTREQQEFQATKMAIHAAMVHRMDVNIGRVLDELRDMQELDNTAIVFLSGNGASAEQLIRADGHDANAAPGSWASDLCPGPGWASAANAPFRRSKCFVHEGGIASPMLVHWPAGFFARGELSLTPCHFVDMLPTLTSMAGVTEPRAQAGVPPLPGKSLVPAFRQDRTIPKDYLLFHHSNNRALRKGGYKLVSAGKDGPWELYSLASNRGETNNFAAKEPERVQAMSAEWQRLQDEFVAQSRRPAYFLFLTVTKCSPYALLV